MIRYVVSRLVVSVAMVLLATLVIFLIANTVPGDPVLTQLGDIAASNPEHGGGVPRTSGASTCRCGSATGSSSSGCAHGDLGISIASQRPVLEDIAQYAPATIELATIAFLLSLLVGLPLGVLAAVRRDTWIDHVARCVSLIGVSAPTFWLAFIMLAVFYGGLEWAPGPGRLDAGRVSARRQSPAFMLIDAAARGRLGHVPRRRGASGAAVDRAGRRHARA